MTEGDGESAVRDVSSYWDTLAPHHWRLENNYLNVSSVRLILGDIRQPATVVGAGQGLIVDELRRQGAASWPRLGSCGTTRCTCGRHWC